MVIPGEPDLQTTGRTFWPLNEQMHKAISRIIGQPGQHATIAVGKEDPVAIRVADVHDPPIDTDQAFGLDLDLMRSLPCYAEPALIDEEIQDRISSLLASGRPKPTRLLEAHRIDPKRKKRGPE
jgi:hypothetical protein